MQQAKTVKEFSIYAARRFLRTAVVIDDKIYEKVNRKTTDKVLTPGRKSALKSDNESKKEEEILVEEFDDKDLIWQKLVSNFAKEHIVCALYEPDKRAKYSDKSEVYKLCLASDIVIVDWNLHGDSGQNALELITNLVQHSLRDIPEQLRLIFVYTSEPILEAIANEVFEALDERLDGEIELKTEDFGLSMHSSNSRIVVLGKPTHVDRIEKYKSHEESEKHLAERSIEEFSKLCSGLLQGTVLLGLATIRENSRKILSKFGESLDPAFLTHRALSLPHEEAADHVIPLLMAEFQSVLEDRMPNPILSENLIRDWCYQWKPAEHSSSFVGSNGNINELAKEFCLEGIELKNDFSVDKSISSLIDKQNKRWILEENIDAYRKLTLFLHAENNQNKNHEFAALMSNRTHYGKPDQILKLGSIVCCKDSDQDQYLLCLQPLCDSVRLSGKKNFIFCKMQSGNTKRKSFVIEENGEYKELFFRPNASNSVVVEFKANKITKTIQAEFEKGDESLKWFISTSGVNYFLVAQLKQNHAQRAAEQFARNLSRVGLTESEWLRLMS